MAKRSVTSRVGKQQLSGRADEYKHDAPFRMIDYTPTVAATRPMGTTGATTLRSN
ncbi:MAG: hypothetical protein R3C45_21765 [Phycisphaerales bacterium]